MKKYITAYLPDEIYSRVQETVRYYKQESISSLVELMFRSYKSNIPTPPAGVKYPPTPTTNATGDTR
jgi:hypothetical protein